MAERKSEDMRLVALALNGSLSFAGLSACECSELVQYHSKAAKKLGL